jgi:predicted RecB family nuclease
MTTLPSLTKTDYMAGMQGHRLLWWRRHEPDAPELQPDRVLQDLFDQGHQVGEIARGTFPGGVLIPSRMSREERARQTAAVIAAGATVVFEASFMADDLFVACDVIVREPDGWRLIEVKSSTSQKEEHVTDLAAQAYVLARNGLDVRAVEVMHLNKEFRHPDVGDLFARTDVSPDVASRVGDVHEASRRQLQVLQGPLPDVPIGVRCAEPWECAFRDRCWPQDDWHISRLYNVGVKRAAGFMSAGVHSIRDLPDKDKKNFTVRRQVQAMESGRRKVEPTLRGALELLDVHPLGFLDFETISRAVPVWPAMGPWGMAAAQFSYHETLPDGGYWHVEHLAEGPQDARPLIAERLVAATHDAVKVVTYSSFEKTRIRDLAKAVPSLAMELQALEEKLVDLHPIVKDHVYDPAFRGSFSLKYVLPALVPELSYSDLVIVDGRLASVEIARLLFVADRIPAEERERVRRDLLAYCERDTWGMVRLVEVLRGMFS